MESSFPWLLAGVVFFAGIVVFVVIMLLWPEWVGITGKTALKNEDSHRGEHQEDDSVSKALSKLQD